MVKSSMLTLTTFISALNSSLIRRAKAVQLLRIVPVLEAVHVEVVQHSKHSSILINELTTDRVFDFYH